MGQGKKTTGACFLLMADKDGESVAKIHDERLFKKFLIYLGCFPLKITLNPSKSTREVQISGTSSLWD